MKAKEMRFYERYEGSQVRVVHHNSPEEFVEFLENPVVKNSYGRHHDEALANSWSGLTYDDAVDKVRFGDDGRAVLAEKVMNDVLASDIITIGRPEIVPSMVGPIPNVPAVLAGHPETMLVRTSSDAFSASAPIRIFIDVGISAGVTVPELIKRGVATLAFTMVMKQIRPIELYAVIGYLPTGNRFNYGTNAAAINVVRIETNPLDLARSSWILSDPAYARRLAFPVAVYTMNDILRIPPNYKTSILWAFGSYPEQDDYIEKMRKALELAPQDIFIKGGALTDKLMLNKPVDWVNKMVAENKVLSENGEN